MNSIRNRVYAGEIAGGADTVEYVIVAIVAVISSWFESARNAANNSINGVGK